MAKQKNKQPKPSPAPDPVELDRATDEGMPEPPMSDQGAAAAEVFDAPGITDEAASKTAFHLVELVIPLADEAPGYQPMLLDLRLRREEAIVVRRLLEGLAAAGAKLANGQPPKKYEDGLRILIRMLGSAIASPDPVGIVRESPNEFQGG
jgi:hypothetical protein